MVPLKCLFSFFHSDRNLSPFRALNAKTILWTYIHYATFFQNLFRVQSTVWETATVHEVST